MTQRPTIAITGANGFIGGELVKYFASKNWKVIGLVKSPEKHSITKNIAYRSYNLELIPDPKLLNGVDYLIHAAYISDKTKQSRVFEKNVNGTNRLLSLSRISGVKNNILISSLSAKESALSTYGKQKFAIEKLFNNKQDIIIRPGLVLGNGGLVGEMIKIIQSKHIIPLIEGGKQPIQVTSPLIIAESIDLIINKNLTGDFNIASSETYMYKDFYRQLTTSAHTWAFMVPVPHKLLMTAFRTMRLLGINSGVSEDSLKGLKLIDKSVDTLPDLKKIGIAHPTLSSMLSALDIRSKKSITDSSKVRYLMSGGAAFVIEYLIFVTLFYLTNHLVLANTISFIIGVVAGFTFHKFWSFAGNHQLNTKVQIGSTFTLGAINLIMTNVMIFILVEWLGMLAYISKVVVLILIVVWNYFIFNSLIFKKNIKTKL